jgi:mannose-6-phosphate isomerase
MDRGGYCWHEKVFCKSSLNDFILKMIYRGQYPPSMCLAPCIEKGTVMAEDDRNRPWGFYDILSDRDDHKIKRITIFPGKRLSYQRHQKRSEHWYMVCGKAMATLNGCEVILYEGASLYIPRGGAHRIANLGSGNVVFIEVQTGNYLGEDDIERIEDDYGRV